MLTTEPNGFEFLKRNKQNVNIGTIKIVREENLLVSPTEEVKRARKTQEVKRERCERIYGYLVEWVVGWSASRMDVRESERTTEICMHSTVSCSGGIKKMDDYFY